jgi:hypothetical protein
MKLAVAAGLAFVLLPSSCTSRSPAPAASASADETVAPTLPTPSASGSSASLSALVLQASLSEQPADWERALFVPFGEGRRRLRFDPLEETQPLEPHSFAIAPDGTFWILDNGNGRIAHYSIAGTFLEAIPDVGSAAADLAFVGSDLYVLMDPRGLVASVGGDKALRPLTVKDGDRALYVSTLVPSSGDLLAEVGGYADAPGTGPIGVADLGIPGDGSYRPLPGLPLAPKAWMKLVAADSPETGDQDFDAQYIGPEVTQIQPIHVALLVDGLSGPRSIPAEVGPGGYVRMGSSVAMYVMISPSRPDDAARFGGGRWLLRIGPGSDPLLWERLPDPGLADEHQIRHLALGPDGSLYLMVLQTDGIQIYRRP